MKCTTPTQPMRRSVGKRCQSVAISIAVAALFCTASDLHAQDTDADGVLDSCEQAASDFTLDGTVDGSDLSQLFEGWGDSSGTSVYDLDGDGTVGGGDLVTTLTNWGTLAPITSPECQAGSCAPCWATVLEQSPDPTVVTNATLYNAMIDTALPWRVQDTATGIEFVLVPPGSFTMGCSASLVWSCFDDENPTNVIALSSAFYIARTELTQADWQAKMGTNPSFFQAANGFPGSNDRPVEQVSWTDAQTFLSATGMRLPSEAEWEFSYRAGTTRAFHGWAAQVDGSNDDSQLTVIGWTQASGNPLTTQAVGQLAQNGLGLYDMAGNVSEWVQDWYSATYYSSIPSTDPAGPSSGDLRGIRGGSYDDESLHCRASCRGSASDNTPDLTIGFRPARDP